MKAKNAFSILEFIVATLIISLITTASLASLASLINSWSMARYKYQEIYLNMRILSLISSAIKSYDQNLLLPAPEIDVIDSFRWNDGSEVEFSSSARKPKLQSSIFTFIRSDFAELFLLSDFNLKIYCGTKRITSDTNQVIAFNAERLLLLNLNFERLTENCYKINFSKNISLSKLDNFPDDSILGFVLVKSINTIYLDEKNILRFISSENGNIIENQPIADNLNHLQIVKVDSNIYELEVSTQFRNFQTHKFKLHSARAKPDFRQILNLL